MPRFFDDYSNTYLTHDSAAGRKQQRRGWKFRENFKLHYQKNLEEWRAGPMGLASAQQSYLRGCRGPNGQIPPDDATVPPLPEGWIEELDGATGIHYYVNEKDGERSWVRPGFHPPGHHGGGGGAPMGMVTGPPPMGMNNNRQGPPPPMMHQPPNMMMPPPGPPPMGQFQQPPPGQFHQPPPQFAPPPGQFQQPPPQFAAPPPSFPAPPGVGAPPQFAQPPPAFPPPPANFPPPPTR
ncbi:predicted protein [Thalassiosira pseudonana CCMP1335]|uniref:WW domain-containing protein n=1 Tax=Thalassiosira pseudonana TaxID=35128 RepID=B8BUD2_THAPS|nr:predicted protein [Thalassiosira pseudonana CCMP1335]EED95266.1 predicted protein [Thalassiosira pseudonana CCMP1335]|eukprot:g10369.t1 g10369   contig4:1745537-1746545(+)